MRRLRALCLLMFAIAALAWSNAPAHAASPLLLSIDGSTWTTSLATNPLYGASAQQLVWQSGGWSVVGPAPASPDLYRIHPGAGLRGEFFARNNSGEAARLGVFARTVTTDTSEKVDPMTGDDFVMRLRINGPGWDGPPSVDAHLGCVVVGQRVVQPGEVTRVSVDALMPFGTQLGTSGQLTVTVPDISVALSSATLTGPYSACKMGDSIPPSPTPTPSPSVDPTPQPTATSRPSDSASPSPVRRRGGFADTGLYTLVTTYPWATGLLGAAAGVGLFLWRRWRNNQRN